MIEKILCCVRTHKEFLLYSFFGILTTVVNYIVYLPLHNFAGCSAALSNMHAWIAAVLVAFLTNKPFVFESRDWSTKTVVPEFLKFVGCRAGSGFLETTILFLTVDCLRWDGNIWKFLTSILVIMVNYICSKFFVFSKKG